MFNLLLLFISFLIFIFAVALSMILYKKQVKEEYKISNHFPHELNLYDNFKHLNLLIVLSSILNIINIGDLFLLNPSNHVNYFLSNLIGIIFIVINILFFTLFYFKFENGVKAHLILSSSFSSLVLMISVFGILFILRSDSFSYLWIIAFIIDAIISLISIIITTIKGFVTSEKELKDNEEILVRKKIIPFALMEWINIILLFITLLLYILILI